MTLGVLLFPLLSGTKEHSSFQGTHHTTINLSFLHLSPWYLPGSVSPQFSIPEAVMGLSWLHKINQCLQFRDALGHLKYMYENRSRCTNELCHWCVWFFLADCQKKLWDLNWNPTSTQILWASWWPAWVHKNPSYWGRSHLSFAVRNTGDWEA